MVAVLAARRGIVINHARFSYGGQLVLDDVSVVIPPRSITAIVGGSGAGKTTLLRLLARYWDLAEGASKSAVSTCALFRSRSWRR